MFDVALADLLADGVWAEELWAVPGRQGRDGRTGGEFPVWFFTVAGETVWGATARVLTELLCLVLGVPGPTGRPPTLIRAARPARIAPAAGYGPAAQAVSLGVGRSAQCRSCHRPGGTSNCNQGPEGNSVAELEIGIFKSGRRAYGFDDIAIVPSRRTRDPEDVDISWQIDAYQFELPLLASAMDGVVSPTTAIEIGRLGGLGVLNLEGLWTRYEDPTPLFDEIRELPTEKATARMQQMYSEPVQLDLVTQRIKEMKAAGITTAASVTPQKTRSSPPPSSRPSSTSWSSRAPWCRPSTCRRRSSPST